MIRVLVVDDSVTMREYLRVLIGREADMTVQGVACNGREAVDRVLAERPDVVTMDIMMPVLDGVEATREIMAKAPVPIVVVSAQSDPAQVRRAFEAMDEGALAVVQKPPGFGHPGHEAAVREIIEKVRLMAGVKVVRRWSPSGGERPVNGRVSPARTFRVVAVGASTGGPHAVQTVLRGLPAPAPVPILLVQHITQGFTRGFADWLDQTTPHNVTVAEDGERLQPGRVYVAPDDRHLGVRFGLYATLSAEPPLDGHRPAVSYLFRKVAETCGPEAVAVLLTGMGRDGAAEMKRLRDLGAVTIGQDEATSVVYGMPAEAHRLGGVAHQYPLDEIGPALQHLLASAHISHL